MICLIKIIAPKQHGEWIVRWVSIRQHGENFRCGVNLSYCRPKSDWLTSRPALLTWEFSGNLALFFNVLNCHEWLMFLSQINIFFLLFLLFFLYASSSSRHSTTSTLRDASPSDCSSTLVQHVRPSVILSHWLDNAPPDHPRDPSVNTDMKTHFFSNSINTFSALEMWMQCAISIELFAIVAMFLKIGWPSYIGQPKSDKHSNAVTRCSDVNGQDIILKINGRNSVRDFNSNTI